MSPVTKRNGENLLKLFIKNMIDLHSLLLVEKELVKLGLRPVEISMGEAAVQEDLNLPQRLQLRLALRQSGLELLENKTDILVHRVKYTIMDIVYGDKVPTQNLSVFLSSTLDYDYTYISNLFSVATNITIEKYYICHKMERVKQLLLYEDLTLTEIADKMHYSSVSHLSSQFKKITGSTPSHFRNVHRNSRHVPVHCG
jgi:hypothetical protein